MQFKNFKELMSLIKDENACREYYAQLRWNGNPVCPHCNHPRAYKLKGGKLYRCTSKECAKNFSVTVGTIFEKSKIPLSTWMGAVYLISAHKKGISSLQLGRDLGVTQKTSWFILHRIRYIMGEPDPEPLTNMVEADEVYMGGKIGNMHSQRRKYSHDREMDNKIAVMGLLERDGKARLTIIGERTFKDVVRENVKPDALLITDTHLSYQGLSFEFAGHATVNHSQGEYRNGIAYTNTVEGFFSSLKRSIYGIYHSVSPKHLEQYCSETSYRYNQRKISDKQRFVDTLTNTKGRLTYKKLIQKL